MKAMLGMSVGVWSLGVMLGMWTVTDTSVLGVRKKKNVFLYVLFPLWSTTPAA